MKSRRENSAIAVSFRVGGLGRDVIGAPPASVFGRRLASVSAKAVPEGYVFLFGILESDEAGLMLNA